MSKIALPPRNAPAWSPVDTDDWMWGGVLQQVAGEAGGVMTYYDKLDYPDECYDFMMSQFQRFQLPLAAKGNFHVFWDAAIMFLDIFNPMAFFCGLTDVIATEDRYYFTHEIKMEDGRIMQCRPEEIETYKLWPAANGNYEFMMTHPGMKGDDAIWELQEMFDVFEEHAMEIENTDIAEARQFFGSHFDNVAHLAMWSCAVWLLSPLPAAHQWRSMNHVVFQAVYQYGECLIDFGNVYNPMQYRKLAVPVQTCVVCQTRLHCAVPVQMPDGNYLFCCEHCDPTPDARERYYFSERRRTCGECRFSHCPHMANKLSVRRGVIFSQAYARHAPQYEQPKIANFSV